MASPRLIALAVTFIGISTVRSSSTEAHAPFKINCFIWRSCKVTQYHRLCYASLSSHAKSIGKDQIKLAISAAEVSESRIRIVATHVKSVLASSNSSKVALKDCIETLSDAESLTKQSATELKALKNAKGTNVAWHVKNAQTWLSAVITNEETCMDGLTNDGRGLSSTNTSATKVVIRKVRKIEQFSSNALALTNSLVCR
ncbi:Pectinesterase [Zostera marina]|uniref:Pectinesterase n=1 Tax=Zostera marina TaxID=29655 RepID=A0A0K9PAM2_ZOSMR|nr:Pectinesterase [Zostera marina]